MAMAAGQVFSREGKLGKRYYIGYYDPRLGRIREAAGRNKKLAEAILHKREIEILENRHLDIKQPPKRILFTELCSQYLEIHSKVNKKSYKNDKITVQILLKYFGDKYIDEITPLLVEEFKRDRLMSVTGATVNRNLALMKNMYTKAALWNYGDINPVKKIKMLPEEGRTRYLEKEEIGRLLDASDDFLKPILILAVNSGMRKGEILHLKWTDVNFNNGLIYIRNSKSGKPREIPMNDLLHSTLKNYKISNPDSEYVIKGVKTTPLSPEGRLRSSFNQALKAAGIKDFHFHDLRHTFASQLVMLGADLVTIMQLLGHSTIDMTMRYAHLSPKHKRVAVELLGSKLKMGTNWAQVVLQDRNNTPEKTGFTDDKKKDSRVV